VKPVFTIFAFALIVCSSSVSAETRARPTSNARAQTLCPSRWARPTISSHPPQTAYASGDGDGRQSKTTRPRPIASAQGSHCVCRGQLHDPATLHGAAMPGLAMLRHSRGRLDVRYSDIAAGGKIAYASHDPRTIGGAASMVCRASERPRLARDDEDVTGLRAQDVLRPRNDA